LTVDESIFKLIQIRSYNTKTGEKNFPEFVNLPKYKKAALIKLLKSLERKFFPYQKLYISWTHPSLLLLKSKRTNQVLECF